MCKILKRLCIQWFKAKHIPATKLYSCLDDTLVVQSIWNPFTAPWLVVSSVFSGLAINSSKQALVDVGCQFSTHPLVTHDSKFIVFLLFPRLCTWSSVSWVELVSVWKKSHYTFCLWKLYSMSPYIKYSIKQAR